MAVETHFSPLIAFAKLELKDDRRNWGNFPIYVKATGGVREMPYVERENLIAAIRNYLLNSTNCPFFFRGDFARVISGEEEGIFSWAGVNLLMNTLIDSHDRGNGAVKPIVDTYGVLDLGGASTQISFFVQSQDILEGLFKLQLGSQRHWNVYTRSFLQFGHVSARKRHFQLLAAGAFPMDCPQSVSSPEVGADSIGVQLPVSSIQRGVPQDLYSNEIEVVDYCLFSGYNETVFRDDSNLHILHDHSVSKCCLVNDSIVMLSHLNGSRVENYNYSRGVSIHGPAKPDSDQFDKCFTSLVPLMEKRLQGLCSFTYSGQCSIGGSYQPSLPTGTARYKFIGTSSYRYVWRFLQLPETVRLSVYRDKARAVCSMNFDEVTEYVKKNSQLQNTTVSNMLPYYCFMASYYLVLLQEGYGFTMEDSLTVKDQIDGHKVGWPLGAMLYEINALPWAYSPPLDRYSVSIPWYVALLVIGCSMALGYVLCSAMKSGSLLTIIQSMWFLRNTENGHIDNVKLESTELLSPKSNFEYNQRDDPNIYSGKSYQSL